MTSKISIGLTMLACSTLWAADFRPLDVKPGEWQTTLNGQTSGMPPIPADVLAKLTPEQRAKMEAMMAGRNGAKSTVSKGCLKKEDLDKGFNMSDKTMESCARSVVTSSGSKQEIRVDCNTNGAKTTGTVKVEAVDSENVKGSMQLAVTNGEHTMNMNYMFASRWIGPACTEK